MPHEFSEDRLVQKTTADFFKDNLYWDSIYAYNDEVLGEKGTLGRMSEKEVILKRYVKQALSKINPGFLDTVYESAVKELSEISYTRSVIIQNREKYDLCINGILVNYKNEKNETKSVRLKLFDFDNPENNNFLAVRELWIQGPLYRRRADIVGFVNGIPLLFMELKAAHKNVRRAYDENLRDYMDTIPHIFYYNAMIILSNGDEAKTGIILSSYEQYTDWKRLKEEEQGSLDFEIMLQGMCSKGRFMDIVENFILFDETRGHCVKILARNHQYLGVNRAVEAIRKRKTLGGKLGVFWHTQGSGKSYSMVFLCKKTRRKMTGNFTFLIVTDREDLERQIYRTFTGVGLVREEGCRASSGEHLKELFREDHTFLFTMIHKFNREVPKNDPYSERSDIIVLSDENHRTQYGTFALNMRNAIPNASFIGFTGTPLFKDDEITKRVFGDYVSTYDFKRAVDDGATVPLYYESRGEKLKLSTERINEKMAEALEGEILDVDRQALLEKELAREYHIMTAGKRLDAIAKDIVDHYTDRWETGKAMVICLDKITTVRMYLLVGNYWERKIDETSRLIDTEKDPQEVPALIRKKEWMTETQMAVILSEEQGEVDKFRKWNIDIEPHRRLIKNGFDTTDGKRIDVETAFKKEDHPFRIAFVCAMWMTGFDVKSLSTLYLDKPLKAHTLMQAIARANRVNEGKENGLIVDYCGILKNLRKALAVYGSGNEAKPGESPAKPDGELVLLLAKTIEETVSYLKRFGFNLNDMLTSDGFEKIKAIREAKEAININNKTRKGFEVRAREVFKKFKAAIHLRNEIKKYIRKYKAINVIYRKLQEDREKADISSIIRKLHEVVERNIEPQNASEQPDRIFDISKINFELLKQEFKQYPSKHTMAQELMAAIEKKVHAMICRNPLRINFQERYAEIIYEYNREKERQTIEQTFEALIGFVNDLDNEEKRTIREGLDEENLALFDLLIKPGLSKKTIDKLKAIAQSLLEALKEEKLKIDHWREKESTRDEVKVFIKDFLYAEETGLPVDDYEEKEVYRIADNVYEHVFRQYASATESVYGVA
ncbi:MAG: type I restriction endonuclease subunit R [Spirochaetales bacterium]|nr:type I restriction endonuclease subunit R [Spirochaetales bacterium]